MDESSNENRAETATVSSPTTLEDLKPKMQLTGTVKRLELYGAFIDIGMDVNALIHISKLGTGHVNRVSDVLKEGDEVTVWVEKVDPERNQVMVTMIEPLDVEWRDLKNGQAYTGIVRRLENYGAFVDIGAEREGLVHISELSHDYVKHPSEVLSVGDEVQVQVLGFSKRKRRIDLSVKNLLEKPAAQATSSYSSRSTDYQEEIDEVEEPEEMPTAMEIALRKAMGDEPIDALEEDQRDRSRSRKSRKRRRSRHDQEDLLNRTLHMQGDN